MMTSQINIKEHQNRQWSCKILVYELETYFEIIYIRRFLETLWGNEMSWRFRVDRSEKMIEGSNLDVAEEVDLLRD